MTETMTGVTSGLRTDDREDQSRESPARLKGALYFLYQAPNMTPPILQIPVLIS